MVAAKTSVLSVDLQAACEAADVPAESEMVAWLEEALAASGVARAGQAEVSIRVVDEAESRDLNRRFRGVDRPTNVLAFPAALRELPGLPQAGPSFLGDLVICAPIVAREAAEQGKSPAAHWGHMLVHGLLHLLGFDHENDVEAKRMEALEIDILAARGLENPYKDTQLN